MLFETNDCSFEVPDGSVDHTVNTLVWSREPHTFSLTITRDPRTEGSLASQVDETLAGLARAGAELRVVGRREGEIPGSEVHEARLHAALDGGFVYQRQLYLERDGAFLLVAVAAPRSQSEACDEAADAVLESLRLRGG
ncbi:MAG: DcrB-related protein [Polyangiaceae bacterium]